MLRSKSTKSQLKPSSKTKQAPQAPRVEVTVKVYFQQNWRRDVRVFQTENRADFRKFAKQIKQVLRLRDNDNIVIKWQDTTGDLITVSSDSEMQLATKNIRHLDTLNICVQLLEEVSMPTLCDKCDQTIICTIRYKCDVCVNFVCCVKCYQTARDKRSIHEHELYKEKFPCYCPMHRTTETDVQTFPRGDERSHPSGVMSAGPYHTTGAATDTRMLLADRRPSCSTHRPHVTSGNHVTGGNTTTTPCIGGGRSVHDIMMQGLTPTSPSYDDIVPEEHNYRSAERSEMVCGPQGETYNQQRMSVFHSPESGMVAIRARRSHETRNKCNQLG